MPKREGDVLVQMAKHARCIRCGEQDLFLMLYFIRGRTVRLCKKCYDDEIDKELAMRTQPRA